MDTDLDQLLMSPAPALADLIDQHEATRAGGIGTAAGFDNRPTWDNQGGGGGWSNQPTWDNWRNSW